MMREGFTLVELLLGLSLLGLIAVTILPLLSLSYVNINKSVIKLEMSYIGESCIEKIKSYSDDSGEEAYIFDKKISDIIDLFRGQAAMAISLEGEGDYENYLIEITKEDRSDKLWTIEVRVYYNGEGSSLNHVEYKTCFQEK